MSNLAAGATGRVIEAVDAHAARTSDPKESGPAQSAQKVTVKAKPAEGGRTMRAVEWKGTQSVGVGELPVPAVTDPADAVVRVTSTGICGTDLHLYSGMMAGMKYGAVMGHEPVGVVESVGPDVQHVKVGDRVAVSSDMACGACHFCKQTLFSMCDVTNPSSMLESATGARSAGTLGMPQLMGGYQGGQAEYLRVPFADVNLLPLPPADTLSEDDAVMLTDILPTAWYTTDMAEVGKGDFVMILGCGPVGMLAVECCRVRGARRIVVVDRVPYRLDFIKKAAPYVETIDFSSGKPAVEEQLREMCKDEPAHAPDVVIELVGMHYTTSTMHKLQTALGLETDSPDAINLALRAVKKGGRVCAGGAYAGSVNGFPIMTVVEKALTFRAGHVPVQRYWKHLLDLVVQGKLRAGRYVTHHLDLDRAEEAYKTFNDKTDGVVKVVLTTGKGA